MQSSMKNKVPKKKLVPVLKTAVEDKAPNDQKSYRCIFCDEPYSDPPAEDWVQCRECTQWSHESCSDFDINDVVDYTCDFCRYGTRAKA